MAAHPGKEALQEAAAAVVEEVLGADFIVSHTYGLPGVDSPRPFGSVEDDDDESDEGEGEDEESDRGQEGRRSPEEEEEEEGEF